MNEPIVCNRLCASSVKKRACDARTEYLIRVARLCIHSSFNVSLFYAFLCVFNKNSLTSQRLVCVLTVVNQTAAI